MKKIKPAFCAAMELEFREEKPRKLLKQLSTEYKVKEEGKGIYRLKGLLFSFTDFSNKRA